MSEPARPFFIPMIGIVALFAALGPAVGGALFIPLSVVFKPTITPDTIALLVLIAALFGHAIGLVAAYVVGVGPAAATGFLYALWDAAAPARWPRALVAGVIGGLIAYGLALRLAPLGATVEMAVDGKAGASGHGMDRRGLARSNWRDARLCVRRLRRDRGSRLRPRREPARPDHAAGIPGPGGDRSSGRGRLRWPTPPARSIAAFSRRP